MLGNLKDDKIQAYLVQYHQVVPLFDIDVLQANITLQTPKTPTSIINSTMTNNVIASSLGPIMKPCMESFFNPHLGKGYNKPQKSDNEIGRGELGLRK